MHTGTIYLLHQCQLGPVALEIRISKVWHRYAHTSHSACFPNVSIQNRAIYQRLTVVSRQCTPRLPGLNCETSRKPHRSSLVVCCAQSGPHNGSSHEAIHDLSNPGTRAHPLSHIAGDLCALTCTSTAIIKPHLLRPLFSLQTLPQRLLFHHLVSFSNTRHIPVLV